MPSCSLRIASLVVLAIALWLQPIIASAAQPEGPRRFDVVIAGGSTAALAAALTAAEQGARVALLEPTDWIGGQLTASAVPAVDEAWHKVPGAAGEPDLDVAAIARDPRNMTPRLRDALLATGNPGDGWVSRFCFEPRAFLDDYLEPWAESVGDRLTIFRETVVKRVATEGDRVVSVEAIQRTARPGVAAAGYDRTPSADLADWYDANPSDRFEKRVIRLEGGERPAVFIDATEWGELMALADAPYLVGVDREDGALDADDSSGQATVYCFAIRLDDTADATPQPFDPDSLGIDGENQGFGAYRGQSDAWQRIWTYRRIRGDGPTAKPGELSLQNWGYSSKAGGVGPAGRPGEGGNDYPFGYLFLTKRATARQRVDWRGGVDTAVLAAAERRAYGWYEWYRHNGPTEFDPDQFVLDGEALGTGHGLAKLPYIRDTRRSIGVGKFLLKFADLVGPASQRTGTAFPDRVGLGAYPADIHPLVGYTYPAYVHENHPTLPFYIPLRALTNDGYGNLLVAGKTMAQTFLANSATRLHPIEWSSGVAAGVLAADMAASGATSAEACSDPERLRKLVARWQPVDWTIEP